jgi:hypothetical protein
MTEHASRIRHAAIPRWMRIRLGEAYPRELHPWMNMLKHRSKIPSYDCCEALFLSSVVTPRCLVGFLDHWGSDPEGNFICEPYARFCLGCQNDAVEFARRLDCGYRLTDLTFHAPELRQCVRMTFSLQKGRP